MRFSFVVATVVEVQMQAMSTSGAGAGTDEASSDETEALLLSRGLELGSPPTVHAVLDGLPLLRWECSVLQVFYGEGSTLNWTRQRNIIQIRGSVIFWKCFKLTHYYYSLSLILIPIKILFYINIIALYAPKMMYRDSILCICLKLPRNQSFLSPQNA